MDTKEKELIQSMSLDDIRLGVINALTKNASAEKMATTCYNAWVAFMVKKKQLDKVPKQEWVDEDTGEYKSSDGESEHKETSGK